jgi:predicted membrane protein (TIGR00267 family)
MPDRPPAAPAAAQPVPYVPHVGETRQYWRDIILGVNDGLVSIFLLAAGVVGGGLDADKVLLTTVAGAIAGAISMAAGEYLATKSQDEVFEREIKLEREHITHHRDSEVQQLYKMFTDMGVAAEDLEATVEAFSKDDETLLNAMKVLEFGIVEGERRSAYVAMAASGLLFLAGSMTSILPFLFTSSTALGLTLAALFTAAGLFVVGVAKTRITNTNPWIAGLENLVIAGIGGVIAYFVGAGVDAGLT